MRWGVHFHLTTNLVNPIKNWKTHWRWWRCWGYYSQVCRTLEVLFSMRELQPKALFFRLMKSRYLLLYLRARITNIVTKSVVLWYDTFSAERDGGGPTIANSVCRRDGQSAPGSWDDGHLLGRGDGGHLQEDDRRQGCSCCAHCEGALQLCRVSLKYNSCPRSLVNQCI